MAILFHVQRGLHFGTNVDVSLSGNGTRVAIGAPSYVDQLGSLRGDIFVYDVSMADMIWYPVGDVINGLFFADNSGEAVSLSLDGERLAIGAPRRRYFRVMEFIQEEWAQIAFVNSRNASFASSISLSYDGRRVGVTSGAHWFQDGKVQVFLGTGIEPMRALFPRMQGNLVLKEFC